MTYAHVRKDTLETETDLSMGIYPKSYILSSYLYLNFHFKNSKLVKQKEKSQVFENQKNISFLIEKI